MKIPEDILAEFENDIDRLKGFGTVRLTVSLHDNRPRFILSSDKSMVPGKQSSGAREGANGL